MRAVILGTDLMYDKSGRLVPIEINTNIGYDSLNRIERDEEWFDATSLISFIRKNEFKTVYLDGSVGTLPNNFPYLKEALEKAAIPVKYVYSPEGLPEDTLFIRVCYSEEALVDAFCRDKVEFLNITSKSSKIAQEFLYKEDGEVKGTMNDFVDNGPYKPNYIVKFRYPSYSQDYPKYYKLGSLAKVYALAESLEEGYILMPCYLNEEKKYEGERYRLLRQWSLLVPSKDKVLEVIDLGTYTKLSGKPEPAVWDPETGELLEGRDSYNSKTWVHPLEDVLLDSGDLVLMSDNVWKPIEDLAIGDSVLSLDTPHDDNLDIRIHTDLDNVSVEDFLQNSTYTINVVQNKVKTEGFATLIHFTFEEDEEEWYDTADSAYPVLNEEKDTVKFQETKNFKVGDKIFFLKVDDNADQVEYIERTIKDLWEERRFIEGYTISLNGSHLFITKAPESTAGYVSIEHNVGFCIAGLDNPECGSIDDSITCICTCKGSGKKKYPQCDASSGTSGCYVNAQTHC